MELTAQNLIWQSFIDSIPSFSSPRAVDLNGDGVLDIVLGGGTDGAASNNGIMAFDGVDGSLLWKRAAHDEIFVTANFQDINGDGIPDVFIGGRQAQFYAIDGSNGDLIWEFYPNPFPVAPGDSGLWNFYSPQFIPDIDGDALPDILVANGGDHSLPHWEVNRPPGHLMILSSATGAILAQAVVPDSAETYCSPLVIDLKDDGVLWILYGTGGESLGGSFYAVPLDDLVAENLENSVLLATHTTRGFIAPASAHRSLHHPGFDFVVQGFGGIVYKFDGLTFEQKWATTIPGAESSAQPVIGNFTGGDHEPDVFCVLYKGSLTSYTDYYQVMLDGVDGSVQFRDSIGTLHFPSGNAVDLNNDGRDEAVISVTYHDNGYFHHKLHAIDFQNESIAQLHDDRAGVNLGCTPYIGDIDNNGLLDIVYVVRKDSLNPVGWKGINIFRYETDATMPNSGIAWGSYIGSNYDGIYQNTAVDCGAGSVISSVTASDPSCNDSIDGELEVIVNEPLNHHTYLWSTGEVTSSIEELVAGQYEVRVTNDLGCYEDYVVTITDPYVISFGGIHPPVCPGGTDGMASVSSTGCPCMFNSCIFSWDNGGEGAQNLALTPGMHTVTIEHPDGCIVTDSVLIPHSEPIFMDTIVFNASCYDSATGAIEVIGNPNYITTYSWDNGEDSSYIEFLSAGDYTLTISDDRSCSEVIVFTITDPDSLIMTLVQDNISCFGETDGAITISATGGTPSYTYSINDNATTSHELTDLTPGVYSIYVIDSNNCESISSSVSITEPDELIVSLTPTDETSAGASDGIIESAVSGGTNPYSYEWDDSMNQNTSIASNLTNGTYSVIVTDTNGCTANASAIIGTLSLEQSVSFEGWSFYPNPATNEIHILANGTFSYAIVDANGKLVLNGNSSLVDITCLSAGVYTLQLIQVNNLQEKKLIIVR
jgi:hypothetical protein